MQAVKDIVFGARYLVLGLGDVYLGAPVATPLDPRHRLVTTKYNPARTWTPENAVGIGGAYMCIYGMEGPGGYQFVGRTVQVYNRFKTTKHFQAETPWLLRFFDQIRFYPVDAKELLEMREAVAARSAGAEDRRAALPLGRLSALPGSGGGLDRLVPNHATRGVRRRTAALGRLGSAQLQRRAGRGRRRRAARAPVGKARRSWRAASRAASGRCW